MGGRDEGLLTSAVWLGVLQFTVQLCRQKSSPPPQKFPPINYIIPSAQQQCGRGWQHPFSSFSSSFPVLLLGVEVEEAWFTTPSSLRGCLRCSQETTATPQPYPSPGTMQSATECGWMNDAIVHPMDRFNAVLPSTPFGTTNRKQLRNNQLIDYNYYFVTFPHREGYIVSIGMHTIVLRWH